MSEFEDKLGAILNDQEAMGRIMALAQSLSGGKTETEPEEKYAAAELTGTENTPAQELSALLGGLDPKLMQTGMRLLQEYNRGDNRSAALLEALRPFVKEERYAKIDRAVQIARLSRVIRVMFDAMKENGGLFHV